MATFPKFVVLWILVQLAAGLPFRNLRPRTMTSFVDPITCQIAGLRITDVTKAITDVQGGTLHPPNGMSVDAVTTLLQDCDRASRSDIAHQSRIAHSGAGASGGGRGGASGTSGGGNGGRFSSFARPSGDTTSPAVSNAGEGDPASSSDSAFAPGTPNESDSTDTNSNSGGSSSSETNANTNNANRLVNPLPVNPEENADPPANNGDNNDTLAQSTSAELSASDPADSNSAITDSSALNTSTNPTGLATDPPASDPSADANVAANTNSPVNSITGSRFNAYDPNATGHSGDRPRERFGGSAAARTGADRGRGGLGLSALGLNSIGGVPTKNPFSLLDSLTGVTGSVITPQSLIGSGLPTGGLPTGGFPGGLLGADGFPGAGGLGSVADPSSLLSSVHSVSGLGGAPGLPSDPSFAGLSNLPLPSLPGGSNGLPTGAVPAPKTFEQYAPSPQKTKGLEDSAADGATGLGNSAAPCKGGDVTVCSDTTTGD